jgi:hypothetical protein
MVTYEGASKDFWTDRLEQELQMVELSALSQLYRYFVIQSSEFYRHNPLCYFWTSNTEGKRIFCYRLIPETFGYTLVSPPEF